MSDQFYYLLAIRMASDLTVTIALPAVLAAILGSKLDLLWGTKPWMLILCLALAALLTFIIVKRKAQYYAKLYEQGKP